MIEIILIVGFVSILTMTELPATDPWREQRPVNSTGLPAPRRARENEYWSGFV